MRTDESERCWMSFTLHERNDLVVTCSELLFFIVSPMDLEAQVWLSNRHDTAHASNPSEVVNLLADYRQQAFLAACSPSLRSVDGVTLQEKWTQ